MTAQHFEFSNRLSRIEAGQGSFKHMLFVGAEDIHQVTYRQRGHSSGRKSRFGKLRGLVLMPASIIAAVAGVMGAKIAIHMAGVGVPTEETIDVFLGAEFMLAMILSTVLGTLLKLRVQDYLGLRVMAICAAMIGVHNLVHMYPQPFQDFAPGGWGQSVLSDTRANTLIVRGSVYAL
ncbi:MAG: hypothetical protein ACRCS3_04765 [Paracoccaceae bacterium]